MDFARHLARIAALWLISCGLLLLMPRAWWPIVSHGAAVTGALCAAAMVAIVIRADRREKPLTEREAEMSRLFDTLRVGREEYLRAMVEIRDKEVRLSALARKAGQRDIADMHDAEDRAIDRYLAVAHGVARGAGGDA